VAAGTLVLAMTTSLIATASSMGGLFVFGTFASYGLAVSVIVTHAGSHHPYSTFGLANAVTLLRLLIVCQFVGLGLHIMAAGVVSPLSAWLFCSLAMVERMLDGIDGYIARKQGIESAFGARFDMEVDALQILALSAVAFMLDKAGAWVLAGGLLRYAFLAAGVLWPAFSAPLPASFRRKAVAVIQGLTLAALLAPIVLPPFSTLAAAMALTLLLYSFTVDTLWLLRSRSKV